MSPSRAAILVLCLYAGALRAQAASCSDPTPADSIWWAWKAGKTTNGVTMFAAPEPPPQVEGFSPAQLPGTYSLTLVPTVGPDRGHHFEGSLTLVPASMTPNPEGDGEGLLRLTAALPEYLSLAPDSLGSALLKPVNVSFLPQRRRLSLLIGNKDDRYTDSGVILEVFTATQQILVGRWVDGGLLVFPGGAHPQGWFCLLRNQ